MPGWGQIGGCREEIQELRTLFGEQKVAILKPFLGAEDAGARGEPRRRFGRMNRCGHGSTRRMKCRFGNTRGPSREANSAAICISSSPVLGDRAEGPCNLRNRCVDVIAAVQFLYPILRVPLWLWRHSSRRIRSLR